MTTHDKHQTKEYKIWIRMKKACYTPSYGQYKTYGKRGVTVCPEWKDDFPQFLHDMGELPKGHKGVALIDPGQKCFFSGNVRWTKGNRGRPKKRQDLPSAKKNFDTPVKVLLTLEKAYLDRIKDSALRRSMEIGHLIEANDILREMIKKEFPIMKQIDMFN